jgi:UDP-N-acetylmuramoyl-L-alanyl-D-glutamate--2,6-diaminopimelate ligase
MTRLSSLSALIPEAECRGDATLVDLSCDGRQVGPGVAFCALAGRYADGHDYAEQAVAAGAAALVVERFLDLDVPQLRVPDVRSALGPLAGVVHGWPDRQLRLAAVTGTDGKTTTAHLLERCLAAGGRRTGSIGTVGTRVAGRVTASRATTPEAPDLNRLLARMVRAGVQDVAMEVSSHGLDLGRVAGLSFAVSVFTNLSPEHLDHHRTMERYWTAKARLFEPEISRYAVIGVDDEWGERLAAASSVPTVTYGRTRGADVVITDVDTDLDGTRVRLRWGRRRIELSTRTPGAVNASNATGAYLAALALGVDEELAVRGLAEAPRVPGRFDVVDVGQPFLVVIDYAHTAAALAALIETARSLVDPGGRVIVVVGARGGRYRQKRAAIGSVASRADLVVVTADSPGPEDPAVIADEILAGVHVNSTSPVVELDRGSAIAAAIGVARPGDAVLIVGRGHERYYERGRDRIELDDRVAAHAAIERLPGSVELGRDLDLAP